MSASQPMSRVRPTWDGGKGRDAGCSTAVMKDMAIAQSRLTAQSQISVPAAVRRKLGIGPGSTLAWHEEGAKIVVRRVGRFHICRSARGPVLEPTEAAEPRGAEGWPEVLCEAPPCAPLTPTSWFAW